MTLRADFASQEYFRNPAAAIERLRILGPVVEVRFPIIGKVWMTTALKSIFNLKFPSSISAC